MMLKFKQKISIGNIVKIAPIFFFFIFLFLLYLLIQIQFKAVLEYQIKTRAESVANAASYAVDTFSSEKSLQRFISALGANRGVEEIVVAWGNPLRVYGSKNAQWFHKLLSEIPDPEHIAHDIQNVLITGKPSLDIHHKGGAVVDYTLPITVLSKQGGLPERGAVMIHLRTDEMRAELRSIQTVSVVIFFLVFTVTFAIYIFGIRKLILDPLVKISAVLEKRRKGDSKALFPTMLTQEFEEIRETFNLMIHEQGEITKQIENQKTALDQFAIVAETDTRGRITYVNDQFCKVSKYSREELIGQDHRIVNSGHHPKAFFKEMWATIGAGKIWRGEVKNKAKDGTIYWVDTAIVPFINENGKPEKYLAIRAVITDRKKAEEEVARSAAHTAILHEAARFATQDLTFEQALHKTLELVCQGVCWPVGHVYQITKDGQGVEPADMWYLDDAEKFKPFREITNNLCFPIGRGLPGRIAQAGKAFFIENLSNDSDFSRKRIAEQCGLKSAFGFPIVVGGKVTAVLEFYVPYFFKNDEKILNLANNLARQLQSVFEKKRAAEIIESGRAQLQAIMDSATEVSIISTDAAGTITLFNRGAERMLGWKADEMIGLKTPQVIHDLEEVIARGHEMSRMYGKKIEGFEVFAADARAGKPQLKEWTYIRKDGSRFPVSLYVTAVYDSKRQIKGFLGIATDITKIKEAESNANESAQHARDASRAKSDFLATMSHEIRTPMNAILGMSELLHETTLSKEQKDYVDRLSRGGETLLSIINNVLDISKIEAGSMEIENIQFDFFDQVSKAVDLLALKAHQKGLDINLKIDPAIPVTLRSDPTRLRQILINLINNAIKFTAHGEINLTVSQEKESAAKQPHKIVLHFVVSDTGIGIPKNKIENLFEPFMQADASTTRKYGGTGLGLNISKRFVELLGGKIWVNSKEGEGSQFHFVIPFEASTEQLKQVPGEVDIFSNKKILIVDDNETNRLILLHHLVSWGVTADAADGAVEALQKIEAARDKPYDLMILDCRMPGMGGFELAQKLQDEKNVHVPMIVMLTSDNRAGDRDLARQIGFASYLVKPVKKDDLRQSLGKIFEQSGRPNLQLKKALDETTTSGFHPERALRILLVDDSEDNQNLIQAYLKKYPHQIDLAGNGKEACEKAMCETYDVILMDIQMPEMDGYTATRLIREREAESVSKRHVPIVALTANALSEDIQKCLDAGCDYYLAKPVKKAVLLEMLQTATMPKAV